MKRKLLPILLALCLILQLPLGVNAASIVDSGFCGPKAKWVLDSSGTLTVSGTGIVTDSKKLDTYYNKIKKIVIKEGITEIGEEALGWFNNATDLTIADSVTTIRDSAFQSLFSLEKLDMGDGVETIGRLAFFGCNANKLTIPASVRWIGFNAFGGFFADRTVYFEGDAPEVQVMGTDANQIQYIFDNFDPYTVYYPTNNKTWTDKAKATIGENLIWKTYRPAGSPDMPKVKSTNKASTGKPSLSWQKVEGAVKYEVYRATSKTGKYSLMKTLTDTSYTNTSATAGKYYYYYVRALDAKGHASDSEIVSRTCDLAQTEITLSSVASSGSIKASWKKVEGAVKYKVYRATSKNGNYKLIKTSTGTSCTDTSVVAGKTYYYKVIAVHDNENANAAYSVIESRTADLAQPNVSITTSSGKPKVSWKKVDGAKGYKVYRATSKNGTYTLLKTSTGSYYKDTKATAGKTYYYKVVAVCSNTAGNSAYSKTVSIKATK